MRPSTDALPAGGSTGSRPSSRWVRLALGAVLLWAIAARVWMASTGLESGHYWDERYSVRNLRQVLESGSLEPVSYYYPSLSYLPQAAVMAAVEGVARLAGEPFSFFAGPLRPSGYLVARSIQVALGGATLLLTFLLGRRLISTGAGVLAAALLAAAPQHVRLSTMWKPDITLLCATLLALWWSLQALEPPRTIDPQPHPSSRSGSLRWLRRYLLAGSGVGLALAAKLNGGPIAAPLAVGAIVGGRRDRRHWLGLIGAGIVSVLVFVALNPQVGRYLLALERNRELYSGRAAGPQPGFLARLAVVGREEARFVVSENFHGPWVGALALLGLLLIAVEAARRRDRASATRALAILVFPLAYTLLYALTTPYAKENNFLQIVPFTALAAAFVVDRAAARSTRRLPPAAGARVTAVALTLVVVLAAAPTQAWVYRSQVPTTWHAAIDATATDLWPLDGRVAYAEAPREALAGRARDVKALLREVGDLSEVPAGLLDLADAELFAASRVDDGGSAAHAARLARVAPDTVRRVGPRWFRARGPTVLAILHPRKPTGSWSAAAVPEGAGVLRIDLPSEATGGFFSIELWLRRAGRGSAPAPEIYLGERALRIDPRRAGRLTGWLTERFAAGSGVLTARIRSPLDDEGTVPVRVYGWR